MQARNLVSSSIFAFFLVLASACGGAEPTASEPPAQQGTEQTERGRLVVGDDACTTDADCVPADCCHAAACVARANAPSCADMMCTMECRGGTMDCGGGCLCHEGRCAARIVEVAVEAPQ